MSPFALRFLLPVATSHHVVHAWIVAGMGLLNAGPLYVWLRRRGRIAA